ncbi:carbohydrate binding family 9 domain-containing protein [Rhodohalobacter sulfatireducens]|uniref:Carbohydrate binding family 9 domain-containing protein n=1 Tax=Rhodohalobacter sulfatireducens TaxID=2911366 RepID=A0ABS9K9Q3_9BACT|nr:DUF5916 domain-containing protein [Rhodohalobacter sulfatireducens]MCG2587584.1 carbohydrate binding family 9 domain-containing protein [Rhodohalobacter sulfatireducens]
MKHIFFWMLTNRRAKHKQISFAIKKTQLCLAGLLILTVLTPMQLFSQDRTKNEVQAYRLQDSDQFLFDGRVTEEFWDRVPVATNFRQQEPNEGAVATEKTEVRIAYDDEYLYLSAILYDSDPSGIKATQKRRDARITADERFTWFFDTFNDQRSAYFMEVNPNALRTDGLITTGQGQTINLNWDGIWDAKAEISDIGWTTEIKIPFRTFNFDPDSDTWGVNFMRVIRRKSETVLWTGYQRNQGIERPQDGGLLTGLTGMSQGLGLEVVPFGILTGSEQKLTGGNETDTDIDGGLDINYSITPSLKASLTFNTDFAEAEVDQRIVNLTRFAVQFPEQRDFFLEGSNIYEFAPASRVNPYFSRRIGLRGGRPIPITYGARLLGNTGPYNLALLHVRTGELGDINPENFSVARVKRNIGRESTIGVVYTRRATEGNENSEFQFQDRHTFGTDLELGTSTFLGDKNLQFQAFFVYHNAPIEESTTEFWDRTSRGIRLNYPNDPWAGHVSYREFGNAYDPAVGFAPRNAFRRFQPSFEYSPQFPGSDLVQQIDWELRFEHLTDLDFELLTQEVRLTLFDITFMTGDVIEVDIARNYERLEFPFDIRRDESIIIPVDEYRMWTAAVEVQTASYRKVSAGLEIETGGFWSGTQTQIGFDVSLRPFPGLELNPEYIRTNVDLAEGDFSTDLFRFEANIDFTNSLFFTTNVQFDNLSKLLGTNNRLRWIITPGSDLYLVYNHNWLENEQFDRFRTLNRSGAVKVSYTHRF